MKNEMKILIAAIVVILLLLVGAYALSGSNNPQPSATPTVPPVTATPTTVPGGSGSTVSVTPAPSVAPTVTPVPSVTPTPVPENGVKQTEFGYWITYPPLDPQKWSDPKPIPSSGNIVYFEPTYGTLCPHGGELNSLESGDTWYQADLYREGNMSENVTVTIHMTYSSNIVSGKSIKSTLVVPADYRVGAHGDGPDVFTDLGDGYYEVTFEPGVSKQYVCIHVNPIETAGVAAEEGIPEGWVKLTLTGANNGFDVDGARNNFLLDIKDLPNVYFDYDWGGIYWTETEIAYDGYFEDTDNSSPAKVYVTIPVYREGNTANSLAVSFSKYVDGMPDGAVTLDPLTFAAGDDTAYLRVGIEKSYIMDFTDAYVDIDIEDGAGYYGSWYDYFEIYINDYDYKD